MLRSKLAFVCVAVMGASGLAACGGDSVSAETYVQEYCAAAQPYLEDLQAQIGSIFQGAAGGDEEAMQNLSDALGTLSESTDEFVGKVEDIGVPDVEGGEEFHNNVVAGLEEFKSTLDDAQEKVDEAESPQAAASSLQTLQGDVQNALDVGDPPGELQQAFEDDEDCQQLEF